MTVHAFLRAPDDEYRDSAELSADELSDRLRESTIKRCGVDPGPIYDRG